MLKMDGCDAYSGGSQQKADAVTGISSRPFPGNGIRSCR